MNAMSPFSPNAPRSGLRRKRKERAIALVITLLMLAVITFLAIAFLAMTSRDKKAITTSLDVTTSRTMSDAALARAQAQILSQMMAANDILSYDYSASHNYISAVPFASGNSYFTNVNYDSIAGGSSNAADWAQNIGNLFYDPRPPVFIVTNPAATVPSTDFRYWVDVNRNGKFEGSSNGVAQATDSSGNLIAGQFLPAYGEPEWIGVLKYPQTNHSFINPFVGRYAYMVLPIGKTLDLNYIHNYSKALVNSGGLPNRLDDEFTRDEGVGSWELNLAAYLYTLSPSMYSNNTYLDFSTYIYTNNSSPNQGGAFRDASQFLAYRYNYAFNNSFPLPLSSMLGSPNTGYIDEYGIGASNGYPFDATAYVPTNSPWPGSYNSNTFYDMQDLFNPVFTGYISNNFASNLSYTLTNYLDTTSRYTYQRLLASIGTSSEPEYGVYVYDNAISNSGNVYTRALNWPSFLKTKVNINYDNTSQIQAGPYNSKGGYNFMPTNLQTWTPISFFTNAADSLLRSQIFIYSNYVQTNGPGGIGYIQSTNVLETFGITNIPVYNSTNPGIVYNEQVHRMLQLAANIYDAANSTNLAKAGAQPIYHPSVFRPLLQSSNIGGTNTAVYIVGYTQVSPSTPVFNNIVNYGFKDLTSNNITTNDYVWGVPWVVGANKYLPAFNQYSYTTRIDYSRQILFLRKTNSVSMPDTNNPPASTNQFYVMGLSNNFGIDAWNPYLNNFYGASGSGLSVFATNLSSITLTNNTNWGQTYYYTNSVTNSFAFWPGSSGFKTFLQTNFISVPLSYFSEYKKTLIPITNQFAAFSNIFLPQDFGQIGWPVHNWTVNITNRICYTLIDGATATGAILDFVNLGPFGTSISITNLAFKSSTQGDGEFNEAGANDSPSSPKSLGFTNQIKDALRNGNAAFNNSLNGITPPTIAQFYFTTPAPAQSSVLTPYYIADDIQSFMPSDPLVHYTPGDLFYPNNTGNMDSSQPYTYLLASITNTTGRITPRYTTGAANGGDKINIFGDPQITNSDLWQFPTNLFPTVGWLGRVHRGTPWQTVYLKSDITGNGNNWATWVNNTNTYPTNDWSILDLFTTAPNDNAARGLLSVNQGNDAAWAAVFSGVVALTDNSTGVNIHPTNTFYLMDTGLTNINVVRTNQFNTNFHSIGDIFQSPSLTVNSQFSNSTGLPTDEMVERIPQQIASLLKTGLPQFVIYSWGQALRPKNLYSSSGSLNNICTNYEITGEFLTRTVCHVVGDRGATNARIVVDSYNIEPSY